MTDHHALNPESQGIDLPDLSGLEFTNSGSSPLFLIDQYTIGSCSPGNKKCGKLTLGNENWDLLAVMPHVSLDVKRMMNMGKMHVYHGVPGGKDIIVIA